MDIGKPSWSLRIANFARAVFWVGLVIIVLVSLFGSQGTDKARTELLNRFQQERKSHVIAVIHRQESVSVLGVPVSRYISIEDSEAVLRAIRFIPPEEPIDLILHTPGGLVLAAEQIAKALVEHKGKVTVFVPHYAMSGGTLIALAADEIVMDANAVLGPVDPQIGEYPAASIVRMVQIKKPEKVDDEMLILADIAQKARIQVASFVAELLLKHMPEKQAFELAETLSGGRWTHDFPITVQAARQLGLRVSTDMPRTVYDLMDLYPQGGGQRPSVLYVPVGRNPGSKDSGAPRTDQTK